VQEFNVSMRKGQITRFILLGMIILMSGALLIFMTHEQYKTEHSYTIQSNDARDYLEMCISEKSRKMINLMGLEGGNIKVSYTAKGEGLPVRTYLKNGKKTIPTITELQDNFSIAIEKILPICLKEAPFTFTKKGDPKVKTLFTNTHSFITVDYPLEVLRDTGTDKVDNLKIMLPVRIPHYLSISEEIIDSLIADPGWFDVTAFASYDVGIHVLPAHEGKQIIQIQDNFDEGGDGSFLFSFGVVIEDKPAPTEPVNNAPLFMNLRSNYTIQINKTLKKDIHSLDLEQENMTYMIDAPYINLFIDKHTGVFVYTPEKTDIGTHFVTFYVNDGAGGWNEKEVRIDVIE
jgi:hypothetical protein